MPLLKLAIGLEISRWVSMKPEEVFLTADARTLVSEVTQAKRFLVMPCRKLTYSLLGFGGWGMASRMWGLTLDNILSATVVLANGSIVTVSENSNPELFWV